MAAHNLDQLRQALTQLSTRLDPLQGQLDDLRKEKTAHVKAVRKYMEQNELDELPLCGILYTLVDESDVKCTMARLRATLPDDVVAQYIQANTVMETKFRKTKITPPS